MSEGGKNRRKITFPALVNALIYFSEKISFLYENKDKEEEEKDEDNDYLYDITKLENDDNYYEFLLKIYEIINDTIKVLEEDFPQMALKLNLLTSRSL